jgi:hypothetical protein
MELGELLLRGNVQQLLLLLLQTFTVDLMDHKPLQ